MTDIKKLIRETFKDVEKIEAIRGEYKPKQLQETNYPKPLKRHFFVYQNFGMSLEEHYFWIKDTLEEFGFIDIEKIVDTFTASEQSAFFGSAQQRLGIQQDKASSYLAVIGKMVKELFQIVRDIKLLEEREVLYKKSKKGDDAAEKTLKGVWIDFVDNGPGQLKASSVYGLAAQIGYNILPDLFFSAPAALKLDDVGAYVKKLDFNEKVKTVLIRKLEMFIAWRDATEKEITSKKRFTIQYLRQHYNSIKLYMDWVKPYLRNVKRLGMDPETQLSANIVGAFEGSVVEVELLAKKPHPKPGKPVPVILLSYRYRTRPVMQTGQDYQRGPVHLGRMELTWRAYVWTEDEIAAYRRIKQEEDFEMLKSIDTSIEQAMDYLGDELRKYLQEAGEVFGKEDELEQLAKQLLKSNAANTIDDARAKAKGILEKKSKRPSAFEPFTSVFRGFKELGGGFIPGKSAHKEAHKREQEIKEEKEKLKKAAVGSMNKIYEIYKKAFRLIVP